MSSDSKYNKHDITVSISKKLMLMVICASILFPTSFLYIMITTSCNRLTKRIPCVEKKITYNLDNLVLNVTFSGGLFYTDIIDTGSSKFLCENGCNFGEINSYFQQSSTIFTLYVHPYLKINNVHLKSSNYGIFNIYTREKVPYKIIIDDYIYENGNCIEINSVIRLFLLIFITGVLIIWFNFVTRIRRLNN